MTKILGVIPARYASTRFPAKPLADVHGKSMIRRVFEQVSKAPEVHRVVVATDHDAIASHVRAFGGEVVMTRESHPSGTDRCFEALTAAGGKFDYVINVQGDEPFIRPEQIALLANMLDGRTEIGTLIKAITDQETLFNPSVVKAVLGAEGHALYFSRSPIPHVRNRPPEEWIAHHRFYKHIGMYAYRADVLARITTLTVSVLERAESLEQLRWLENGYRIQVAETGEETIGVDTPDDLAKAIAYARDNKL